jgi:hypothetical protein
MYPMAGSILLYSVVPLRSTDCPRDARDGRDAALPHRECQLRAQDIEDPLHLPPRRGQAKAHDYGQTKSDVPHGRLYGPIDTTSPLVNPRREPSHIRWWHFDARTAAGLLLHFSVDE